MLEPGGHPLPAVPSEFGAPGARSDSRPTAPRTPPKAPHGEALQFDSRSVPGIPQQVDGEETTTHFASAPAGDTAGTEPAAERREGAPRSGRLDPPVYPPSGSVSRVRANIAAIELAGRLDAENRFATEDERRQLAQWSGWGAAPEVFDARRDNLQPERAQLRSLLSDTEWAQAKHNTLNAHYTDPALAQAMWDTLGQAGFSGGRVLEPGCGSGTFLAAAPPSAQLVGVELDATTARIAAAIHPAAQIRNEGFQNTRIGEGEFAAVIGNVPFGDYRPIDHVHNQGRHSIHNHFIIKSLALTAPGGYVAVVTSRWTMDAESQRARQEMLTLGDFVGAVRLPSGAFSRVAGTDVVTDIVILRRRETDRRPDPNAQMYTDFLHTDSITVTGRNGDAEPARISRYFHCHPEQIIGTLRNGQGVHGSTQLIVDGTTEPDQLAHDVRTALGRVIEVARGNGRGLSAGWHNTIAVREIFDRGLYDAAALAPRTQFPVGMLRHDPELGGIVVWGGHRWEPAPVLASRAQEWTRLLELRDLADLLITAQRDGHPEADRIGLRGELTRAYDRYVAEHGRINRFSWREPSPVTQSQHDKAFARLAKQWRTSEGVASTFPLPAEVSADLDEQAWLNPRERTKVYPHLGKTLRQDPTFALVRSLESYDDETGTVSKAAIFYTDVVRPESTSRTPAEVHSIEDALAITLDESAAVDVDRIAELLQQSRPATEELLSGHAFRAHDDPDVWIVGARYLSGNVRTRLTEAEELAEHDPRYRTNVEHLRAVQPPRLNAAQISVNPGVTWIPKDDYARFVRDTFQVPAETEVRVEYAAGRWSVEVGNGSWWTDSSKQDMIWGVVPKGYASSTRYNFEHPDAEDRGVPHAGVRRGEGGGHNYGALEMLNDLLNAESPQITKSKEYRDASGGDAIHDAATRVAGSKARRLAVEFEQWALHTDPDRAERLVTRYNELFNSCVAPRYDGSRRQFPGLGTNFAPYDYQRNAVARIVSEPTVLLDHVVGAGKTGTMLMGAMELRRLGLVNKPWIVVPNHLVEDFVRQAKQWYPGAAVLSGGAATTAEERRLLIAQSASHDWDMVIVPMSVFVRVPVSAHTQAGFIRDKIDEFERWAQSSDVENEQSVKQMEKAKARLQTRLDEVLSKTGTDTGLGFESSGCDYLFVDEAHSFKNLARASGIVELSCGGSNQALDLQMKLDYLRDLRRQEAATRGISASTYVERVATFATGTKVSNSLAEEWVMQTYLAPEVLAAAGVDDLNAWGKTFTSDITRVELNSSGTKLRAVSRVAEFQNVGDLVALSALFVDSVGQDRVQAKQPLPHKAGGEDLVVSWEPSMETLDFISDLGYRSANAPRDMRIDNSLKIASDGRDVSLSAVTANLDREALPEQRRAWQVAQRVLEVHDRSKNNEYRGADGAMSPVRGGLQILFCDRSTPKADGSYSMYDEIRDELVAGGMDRNRIRFIHDYPTAAQKAVLFQQCRDGHVNVLIGSTEKMGTGLNVQDRAIALHHVDAPWKPSDVIQREGRIIRQGNQNDVVFMFRYVARRTFDTVMWQTIERKGHYVTQLAAADRSLRSMPDLGADSIADSAATTKAIATGDPRYLRQVELAAEVDELQSEADAHFAEQRSVERERETLRWQVPSAAERVARLETAAPQLMAWASDRDRFTMVLDEQRYTDRSVAAQVLREELRKQAVLLKHEGAARSAVIGEVVGHVIEVSRPAGANFIRLQFRDLPIAHKTIGIDELYSTPTRLPTTDTPEHSQQAANGLLRRLENMAADAEAAVDSARWSLEQAGQRLDQLEATTSHDFPRARELHDLSHELGALQQELREAESSPEAIAAAAERADRLARNGRDPGWSLMLNPTPQLIESLGFDSADQVRDMMLERRHAAQSEHRLLANSPAAPAMPAADHLAHLDELDRERIAHERAQRDSHEQPHPSPPAHLQGPHPRM